MTSETETQSKAIADYLKAGGRITGMDALTLCGCWRLSARIFELRNDGMNIESKIVARGKKRVAEYYLV